MIAWTLLGQNTLAAGVYSGAVRIVADQSQSAQWEEAKDNIFPRTC